MLERQDLDVDVLVIGGGGAGCLAAIKANEAGATVLLVTKGPFPSGNTSVCRSYAVALGPGDSPDRHYQDLIRAGGGLNNQPIVRAFTEEVVKVTNEMDSWGLDLDRKGKRFASSPNPGHTVDRNIRRGGTTGKAVMDCLGRKVLGSRIQVLEHTMVAGLIQDGDRVVGAWGLAEATGALVCVSATSVVLATGGMGQLFPLSKNVRQITGEGYAFAFEAGADLVNMEMIDFRLAPCHPARLRGYNHAGSGNRFRQDDRLFNGVGERFTKRYYPELRESELTIFQRNRAVGMELLNDRAGVHGGIYLDVSDTPAEYSPRFAKDHALFGRMGVNLDYQPMELMPGPRTFLGGARIDETGATTVPGLFAAGEVAGGSLGADRLGGDALAAALGIGSLTGTAAAQQALAAGVRRSRLTDPVVDRATAVLRDLTAGTGEVAPGAARRQVQQLAYQALGPARSEAGLDAALDELARLRREVLPRLRIDSGSVIERTRALVAAMEVTGQVRLAEIIATAARFRTESRGHHFRSDFPDQDDERWVANVVVNRDGEAVHCSTLAAVRAA
jgi:fumarate reductase (CoM/CoB) subunit A